jgi:hypothetical protein
VRFPIGTACSLGALVPVDVEGVRGKRFVLAEELALPEKRLFRARP